MKSKHIYIAMAVVWLVSCLVVFVTQPAGDSYDPVRHPTPDQELGTGRIQTELGFEDDDYHFKQHGYYEDDITVRVTKTLYKNRMPYLTRVDGNYVLYEYFRQDGTRELDRMVFPEAGLGASVISKYRERIFDASGDEILEERYIREDLTLGAVSNNVDGSFTTFREDGKRIRNLQEYDGNDYRQTYYRLDGVTVWWVSDFGTDYTQIFFDRNGKPWQRKLYRESATPGGFSIGSDDPPLKHSYDTFFDGERKDFRQTWYTVWDPDAEAFRDIIGKIEVFGEDGETLVRELDLELDPSGVQSIKKSVSYVDGKRVVNVYPSGNGMLVDDTIFDGPDALQEVWFQPFVGQNPWGVYDDDSQDI